MKAIKQYDELIRQIKAGERKYDYREADNADLFEAYWDDIDKGRDTIDFHDVLWDDRIPELVDAMLEHGVYEFTISSGASRIQETILAIMNAGYGATLDGIRMVFTGNTDWEGNRVMAPAFLMHLIVPEKF